MSAGTEGKAAWAETVPRDNRGFRTDPKKKKHHTREQQPRRSHKHLLFSLCSDETWTKVEPNVNDRCETLPPAGCGRPGEGCARGSALALHFLGSFDSLVSWAGQGGQNLDDIRRPTEAHSEKRF